MPAPKTARAAPARAGGDPQIEQLGSKLDLQSTLSALELQTKKIAKRFGLSNTMAATVAEIAFNVGGA
jgi:hypothetical protein